jgi:hypothetical protein
MFGVAEQLALGDVWIAPLTLVITTPPVPLFAFTGERLPTCTPPVSAAIPLKLLVHTQV